MFVRRWRKHCSLLQRGASGDKLYLRRMDFIFGAAVMHAWRGAAWLETAPPFRTSKWHAPACRKVVCTALDRAVGYQAMKSVSEAGESLRSGT
jgi:hypothetical protein